MVGNERPKSREAAKLETRDALIRAGIELYMDGSNEPSLDALCAHAGYTRGAFYVHFGNRNEFLLAVVDAVLRTFVDSVIADQGGAESTEVEGGQVGETIARFISAAQAERGAVRFLSQVLHRHPEIRERNGAVLTVALDRLTSLVEREQRSGNVRPDIAARDLALILVTAAMGIAGLLDSDVNIDLSTLPVSALALLGSGR